MMRVEFLKPSQIQKRLCEENIALALKEIHSFTRNTGKHKRRDERLADIRRVCQTPSSYGDMLVYEDTNILDVKVLITKYDMCKSLTNVKYLHINCTHKLVDIGYPVVVIRFTNCNGRF